MIKIEKLVIKYKNTKNLHTYNIMYIIYISIDNICFILTLTTITTNYRLFVKCSRTDPNIESETGNEPTGNW